MSLLTLIGHLSFVLSALSFLMSSILYLRLLAISSTIIGIGYNSLIAIGWPSGNPNAELWTVVFWLCVFLIINLVQSVRLLYQNTEIKLTEPERQLQSIAAPKMRSRDWKRIMDAAEVITLKHGDLLIARAAQTDKVYLLTSGTLVEVDSMGKIFTTTKGTWLGELSWALNEQYGGSPSMITASDTVLIRAWKYQDLAKLAQDLPTHDALLDGFLRGVVRKREILLPVDKPLDLQKEVSLTVQERFLHAHAFPSLSTGELKRLIALSTIQEFTAGEELTNNGRIGVIAKGSVRINRDDDQSILLHAGYMIGEIAFISERDLKVKSVAVATEMTHLLWWDLDTVQRLQQVDPPLYAGFIRNVSRGMAVKLTQPLEQGSQYVFGR
jgi:CRP-like cAMP-binding protein